MPLAPLNRRSFLRAAGVSIALPWLDAMIPAGLGAEAKAGAMRARRMLLIGRPLGMYAPFFFPEKPGKDYEPSRYLKTMQDFRRDFTVISGMSHRGYPGGHGTEAALMTGIAPERMRAGEIRNTISLDQEVATRLGGETRYASLVLGGGTLSWNYKGVQVPSESRATQVFKNLFIDGTPAQVQQQISRIETGQSILDGVRGQAKTLARTLGPADRDRLDLLLSSIREAEQRLQQDQAWVRRPKPKVTVKPFVEDHITDSKMLERARQWYDLCHLALQTDSTRVISLYLWSHMEHINLAGLTLAHHDASHHGQDEAKIKQLALIEEAEMKLLADFLGKMRATDEGGQTLLERTVIFHSSNLGNASSHAVDNLPIIVAGGGLKHAGHLAFDRKDNASLSNLFVRMLQQMGIESDRFGNSTGTFSEV